MKLYTNARHSEHEPYLFTRMLGAYDSLKLKIIDFVLWSWPCLVGCTRDLIT